MNGPAAAAAVAGKNGYSLISDEKFRQLYALLLKYSLLGERFNSALADSAEGVQRQAAAAVGIALDLELEDTVVLTPGSFVANFVKGVPVRAMWNHQHANGASGGTAFSYPAANVLTPDSSTVSAQVGLATGAALANKLARNRKVAVVFVEDNTAALKGCKEALELAAAHKLPILYVIGKAPEVKHEDDLKEIGELFPAIVVDTHDVVAVYRVAHESIARVRGGGGPALIACMPYSLNGAPLSAVASMERYLTRKELFSDRWKREVIAEFNREMDAACLPELII
jgi:TPP-dependent pyruvate/acetoin dehydrogenase alpha subunit